LATLATIVTACGLNQREQAVAETNAQIEAVYDQSESLANTIYQLPDQPTGPESFTPIISAYRAYRDEVNRLNVLLHRLGGIVPELNGHLRTSFDPEAEASLGRCDDAIAIFEQSDASPEAYQEALTAMCLCIESYADAVTAVSQEYARVAG
jgi:hypothetical protein